MKSQASKKANPQMQSCSVTKKVQIVPGNMGDYKQLAHYHYRDSRSGPYAAIFAMRLGRKTMGVIVYTMPSPGVELRNIATENFFAGFDRRTQLALVNKNIRCISRVIIEPRLRGLGLAGRLVRETLPRMNVPIVEAMAVMGLVNPFFEKAGMKAYAAKMPVRCVQLAEALSLVGIEKGTLIDARATEQKLSRLGRFEAEFIELQIKHFLQSYGKRRMMSGGPERTAFVLSKLTTRPIYYIWINSDMEVKV